MRQLIAILLVPFFVVGNSFVHAHDAPGLLAGNASTAKYAPHFHFGNGAKHGHHHDRHGHDHEQHAPAENGGDRDNQEADDAPASLTEPGEHHDSDAIYVAAVDYTSVVDSRGIQFESCAEAGLLVIQPPGMRPALSRVPSEHAFAPELPLYLLHAALRL